MEGIEAYEGNLVMAALMALLFYSTVRGLLGGISVGMIAGYAAVPLLYWMYESQGLAAESVMIWSVSAALVVNALSGWQPWQAKAAEAPER